MQDSNFKFEKNIFKETNIENEVETDKIIAEQNNLLKVQKNIKTQIINAVNPKNQFNPACDEIKQQFWTLKSKVDKLQENELEVLKNASSNMIILNGRILNLNQQIESLTLDR